MTGPEPLPRMGPGVGAARRPSGRRGDGDGGIDHGLSPSLQPPPYSPSPRRGGGRLVPARCGGGEWSSGIRRRGRKPPFRACAGVRVRPFVGSSSSRPERPGGESPGQKGEQPCASRACGRTTTRSASTTSKRPTTTLTPGVARTLRPLPNLFGSSRKRRRNRAFSPAPPSPPPRTAPRPAGHARRTGPARWPPAP